MTSDISNRQLFCILRHVIFGSTTVPSNLFWIGWIVKTKKTEEHRSQIAQKQDEHLESFQPIDSYHHWWSGPTKIIKMSNVFPIPLIDRNGFRSSFLMIRTTENHMMSNLSPNYFDKSSRFIFNIREQIHPEWLFGINHIFETIVSVTIWIFLSFSSHIWSHWSTKMSTKMHLI